MLRRLLWNLCFPIVVIGLPVVFLLARSGVATIPVATQVFYATPTPHHAVVGGPSLQELFTSQITDLINARVTSAGISDRAFTLTIPESAFTTTLTQYVQENAATVFVADKSQAAVIDGQGLEVFLPLQLNRERTAVRATITTALDHGLFAPKISSTTVGQLGVPSFIVRWILESALGKTTVALNEAVGKYATFDAVEFTNGNVVLHGQLTVEVKTFSQ